MSSLRVRPPQIAEFLCNRQPTSIRQRILADPQFVAQFGLKTTTTAAFRVGISLPVAFMISLARKALNDKAEHEATTPSGTTLRFRLNEQGELAITAQEFEVTLAEFSILSPSAATRLLALEKLADDAGPTAPDFAPVLAAAAGGPLTDEQVMFVLNVSLTGVAARHRRALLALQENHATLDDLVPDELAYYEALCGPRPVDEDPEAYIGGTLTRHRKELLRRNLLKGLPIGLIGNLRDDLRPSQWLGHLSDDELWTILEAAKPSMDPISLLSAVDLALGRQHDARFRDWAESGISALAGQAAMRVGNADMLELMAAFATIVQERLNLCEGAMLQPPYWRRMCAWMQAAVLLRLADGFGFDPKQIRRWSREVMPPSGRYGTALDLRLEPMYKAAELSADSIRCEIVGRLMALTQRHIKAGVYVPRQEAVEGARVAVGERGYPGGWALPGPLEGHIRPATTPGREMPDEEVKRSKRAISRNPGGTEWARLAYFSQLFNLGEKLVAHLRNAVPKASFGKTEQTRISVVERLTNGALIAAAQRDVELARVISAKILSGFEDPIHGEELWVAFRALLLAGAAFEDEEEWAAWLSEGLAQFAMRVERGVPVRELIAQLSALRVVLPLQLRIHARAEAIARAAL